MVLLVCPCFLFVLPPQQSVTLLLLLPWALPALRCCCSAAAAMLCSTLLHVHPPARLPTRMAPARSASPPTSYLPTIQL